MGCPECSCLKEGIADIVLPIDAMFPNPNQPCRVFTTRNWRNWPVPSALWASLTLTVLAGRPMGTGGGEQRLRAAWLQDWKRSPACRPGRRPVSSLLALVENLQRRDLDFWEEALALDRLISVHISRRSRPATEPVGHCQQAAPAEAVSPGTQSSTGTEPARRHAGPCSGWKTPAAAGRPRDIL